MTRKMTSMKPKSVSQDPKNAPVPRQQVDKKQAETLAHMSLEPPLQAALTLTEYNKDFGKLPLDTLIEDLKEQCRRATQGDTARAEELLTAQAHTLDSLFNSLARRAALNMGQYMGAAETYLRLALKAQSQCRTTLETLVLIKNPPVVIARQANIAHGPQQVNNTFPRSSTETLAGTGNSGNEPIRLLEKNDGKQLDAGKASTTGGVDSHLEAVGAIHRPEDDPR